MGGPEEIDGGFGIGEAAEGREGDGSVEDLRERGEIKRRRGRRDDEEGGEGFGDPQVGGGAAAGEVAAGGEEKPVHV